MELLNNLFMPNNIVCEYSNTIPKVITLLCVSVITGFVWRIINGISKIEFWYLDYDKLLYKHRIIIQTGTYNTIEDKSTLTFYREKDNAVIITAIMSELKRLNISYKDAEIVNDVTDEKTTKENILSSKIAIFPESSVYYKNMKIKVYKRDRNWSNFVSSIKEIDIYGNDKDNIVDFIEICKKNYVYDRYKDDMLEQQSEWLLYDRTNTTSNSTFHRYPLTSNKTMNDVFFDRKEELMNLLDDFETNSGVWSKLNRTKMFRLFTHGPPGTGKTSLVKALVHHTKRHLVRFKLSDILSDNHLFDIMSNPYIEYRKNKELITDLIPLNKRIYLFEDMDCEGSDQIVRPRNTAPKDSKSGVTLAGLLNILDGHYELSGAMVIINTNDISKFDKAIYRPGRMEMVLNLDKINSDTISEFLSSYYNEPVIVDNNISIIPCVLEEICQRYRYPSDVILKLEEYNVVN